jgi:hypothetical protein
MPVDGHAVQLRGGAAHLDRRGHDLVADVVAVQDADAQGMGRVHA